MSRQAIVDLALTQLGKPYIFGADAVNGIKLEDTSPSAFDCSFLVEWSYWNAEKLTIPRNSADQFAFCKPTDNPLPGDLGFFADSNDKVYHVGIVVDSQRVVEARAKQAASSFETGKVIVRPFIVWANFKAPNGNHFAGWRSHPKLI